MPVMTGVSIWLLTMPFWKSNYEMILILSCLVLGGLPLFMAIQGFKVFPYLRANIEVNDHGFTVIHPNRIPKKHAWNSIGKITHYATAQVLEIRNRDNEIILAISEQSSKYGLFATLVSSKSENVCQ